MTRRKKASPQEQPPSDACAADVGRTKAWQMDHSIHFQLCIKLDPILKYGLLTVSNKQLVIASTSSVRLSCAQRRDTSGEQKKLSFVYGCLMNRRLKGGSKAREDKECDRRELRGRFLLLNQSALPQPTHSIKSYKICTLKCFIQSQTLLCPPNAHPSFKYRLSVQVISHISCMLQEVVILFCMQSDRKALLPDPQEEEEAHFRSQLSRHKNKELLFSL